MIDNQETYRMGHVINLYTVVSMSTPLKFKQFINQVQALNISRVDILGAISGLVTFASPST